MPLRFVSTDAMCCIEKREREGEGGEGGREEGREGGFFLGNSVHDTEGCSRQLHQQGSGE